MEISEAHQTQGATSPFLPGTKVQYAWDSTSLGLLKTCPRLYQYVMLEGWTNKDESIHLRFGGEFHSALEHFEKLKAEGSLTYEKMLRKVIHEVLTRTWDQEASRPWTPDEDTKAGRYKSRNALIRSIIYYLDDHRDDPAKTHILANGQPAVELSFRFELEWGPQVAESMDYVENIPTGIVSYTQPYLLCGHLDKVVEFSGALFVMDHKTTTSTPGDYFFNQFDPSNQMTLYTLGAKVILASPVKGVIINAVQLLVDGWGDTKFKRGLTYRTNDRLEEWLQDLHFWLAQAEAFAGANYWPQNDTSCDKFGGCKFREVCSASPQVRENYLRSNFLQLEVTERWNPLKAR